MNIWTFMHEYPITSIIMVYIICYAFAAVGKHWAKAFKAKWAPKPQKED